MQELKKITRFKIKALILNGFKKKQETKTKLENLSC